MDRIKLKEKKYGSCSGGMPDQQTAAKNAGQIQKEITGPYENNHRFINRNA